MSDVPVMASSLDPQAVARISKLPVGFFVAVAHAHDSMRLSPVSGVCSAVSHVPVLF